MSTAPKAEPSQYAKHVVVLVPGMLSPRITLWPMARQIKRQGFQTLIFPNRYLLRTPEHNAQRLVAVLQTLSAQRVHLVGHSLGGIVIMHALRINSEKAASERFATGKVVLMASPVNGSEFSRVLYAKRLFRPFMGRCAVGGLLNGLPEELDGRETGVISGSARFGLAAMLYKPDHADNGPDQGSVRTPNNERNDGMINEAETQLSGAQDAINVPHSHGMMLFSQRCTNLAIQFLQHGRFVTNEP